MLPNGGFVEFSQTVFRTAYAENQLVGAIVGILVVLVLIAVFVVIFRWLWTSTMPEVFGLKALSFGQSLKILILAGILFGGHRVVDVSQEISGDSAPAAEQTGSGGMR